MFHIIPNPTATFTRQFDTATMTETVWAKDGYQLVRQQANDANGPVGEPRWTIRADRDLPNLTNIADWDATHPEYGVNWSAMGAKAPQEARKYGNLLVAAAEAAEYFNRILALFGHVN